MTFIQNSVFQLARQGFNLLSQFGPGFTPPVDNVYTKDAASEGVTNTVAKGISNLIGVLTVVGGLFFIVNFFLGALGWITAGEDTGKVEKARTRITHAAIGLVLVVAAYGIVGLVGNVIGLDILDIGGTLTKLNPKAN
jgi:hypothetical protein